MVNTCCWFGFQPYPSLLDQVITLMHFFSQAESTKAIGNLITEQTDLKSHKGQIQEMTLDALHSLLNFSVDPTVFRFNSLGNCYEIPSAGISIQWYQSCHLASEVYKELSSHVTVLEATITYHMYIPQPKGPSVSVATATNVGNR